MNKLTLITIAWLLSLTVAAQSLSPEVIASSGEYYQNANNSISYTLGEIATETYSNGSNILTQGFQQAVSITITGVNLDLLVYLEGPYSGSQMSTTLNSEGEIPLSQPYNTAPWNYNGTENVGSIPNANIVDWVLIELRDATGPTSADPLTIIAQQAGFVLKDGSVVSSDGVSNMQFDATFPQNLYIVVFHRNHLGIISGNALTQSGGVYAYDFTTAAFQALGDNPPQKEIASGVFGMFGGDLNSNGNIGPADKSIWTAQAGTQSYTATDANLDGEVDNNDKNDITLQNVGEGSHVPE